MSEHITHKAVFVAALPHDDPERVDAEAHARSCEPCARVLAESSALVARIDRAPAPPPPSADALRRVSAAIEAETARERAGRPRSLLVATAVMAAWGVELVIAKRPAHDPASVAVSLGWALMAAALVTRARVRPRWVLAGAVAASLVLVVASAGREDAQIYALLGIKCTLLELLAAGIPFGAAIRFARQVRTSVDPWHASAIAAAGALAGQAALHLSCKVAHAGPHLLVFHFGAVLMAGLLARVGSSKWANSLAGDEPGR